MERGSDGGNLYGFVHYWNFVITMEILSTSIRSYQYNTLLLHLGFPAFNDAIAIRELKYHKFFWK